MSAGAAPAAATGQYERERRRTAEAGTRRKRVTAARGGLLLAGMANEPPALVGLMIAQGGHLELVYVHKEIETTTKNNHCRSNYCDRFGAKLLNYCNHYCNYFGPSYLLNCCKQQTYIYYNASRCLLLQDAVPSVRTCARWEGQTDARVRVV
jgi:hypothetical protein